MRAPGPEVSVRRAIHDAPLRSEFRAKGVMYRGVVAYLDAQVPGGVSSATATLHTLTGIPELAAPIHLPSSGAFVATALTRAGAEDVEVTAGPAEPDGEARGRPTVRVRRTMRWK